MARTIHLEWNRTSGEITPSEGYRLKRNEEVKFIVQPMTARAASTFATGWALTFTLKQKGNYDATPLFVVTAFSASSDGTYTATAQVASAEIDTALEADATTTDDLAEIDCVADLSLVISAGNPEKSDTIFVTLQNCVTDEDGDGTPTSNVRSITASGYTMTPQRWLGRWTSGTGAIQEGTFGPGLSLNASGVLSATGDGSSSFSPPSPTTLQCWVDASDIHLAEDAEVRFVADQSGNDNHLSQTGSYAPSMGYDSVLGLPYIKFDRTQDWGLHAVYARPVTSGRHFFIVARVDTNDQTQCVFTSPNGSFGLFVQPGAPFSGQFFVAVGGGYLSPPITARLMTGWHIFEIQIAAAGTCSLSVDGDTYIIDSDNLTPAAQTGLDLGASGDDTLYRLTGGVMEVLDYSSVLSSTDRATVLTYLAAKLKFTQLWCDGNSITRGAGVADENIDDYPSQMIALLDGPWTGVNYAQSGQDTGDMIARISAITGNINPYAQHTVVVASEVSNELAINPGRTARQAVDLLWTYCDTLRALDIDVVVTTVIPRDDFNIEADRLSANTLIRAEWPSHAVALADWAANAAFATATGNTTYYKDETVFVHPNEAGCAVLASITAAAINWARASSGGGFTGSILIPGITSDGSITVVNGLITARTNPVL
jgi:hypothetical protein